MQIRWSNKGTLIQAFACNWGWAHCYGLATRATWTMFLSFSLSLSFSALDGFFAHSSVRSQQKLKQSPKSSHPGLVERLEQLVEAGPAPADLQQSWQRSCTSVLPSWGLQYTTLRHHLLPNLTGGLPRDAGTGAVYKSSPVSKLLGALWNFLICCIPSEGTHGAAHVHTSRKASI